MSKQKSPWPTKAVMKQIYEQHLWGGKDYHFYSGDGSHKTEIVKPYVNSVSKFLKSHKNQLTLCDLGCGDFNIGQQLLPFTKTYYAIDIVEELIIRNKSKFFFENVEFQCLDISKDELPKSDCIILRQVLQHLSNSEISKILDKLRKYAYIILTEHLPIGNFEPNKDKIASQGIRLKQNSGVDILASPFNFEPKTFEVLNEVILEKGKGRIVTTLYTI